MLQQHWRLIFPTGWTQLVNVYEQGINSMKSLYGIITCGRNVLYFVLYYNFDCMINLYDNKVNSNFLSSDHVNYSLLKGGGLSSAFQMIYHHQRNLFGIYWVNKQRYKIGENFHLQKYQFGARNTLMVCQYFLFATYNDVRFNTP